MHSRASVSSRSTIMKRMQKEIAEKEQLRAKNARHENDVEVVMEKARKIAVEQAQTPISTPGSRSSGSELMSVNQFQKLAKEKADREKALLESLKMKRQIKEITERNRQMVHLKELMRFRQVVNKQAKEKADREKARLESLEMERKKKERAERERLCAEYVRREKEKKDAIENARRRAEVDAVRGIRVHK